MGDPPLATHLPSEARPLTRILSRLSELEGWKVHLTLTPTGLFLLTANPESKNQSWGSFVYAGRHFPAFHRAVSFEVPPFYKTVCHPPSEAAHVTLLRAMGVSFMCTETWQLGLVECPLVRVQIPSFSELPPCGPYAMPDLHTMIKPDWFTIGLMQGALRLIEVNIDYVRAYHRDLLILMEIMDSIALTQVFPLSEGKTVIQGLPGPTGSVARLEMYSTSFKIPLPILPRPLCRQ